MNATRLKVWVVAWAFVLLTCGAWADEEDPLQHEAKVAARDRQLTHILHTIGVERAAGEDVVGESDAPAEESERVEAPGAACTHDALDFKVQTGPSDKFSSGMRAALHVANLLNNLFVAGPEGRDPVYPPHVFYTLLRATLENEPAVVSCGVAFLRGEFEAPVERRASEAEEESELFERGRSLFRKDVQEQRDMFGAYVFRRGGTIGTADLASLYNQSYDQLDTEGTQWFTHFSYSSPMYRPINSSLSFDTSSSSSSSSASNSGSPSAPSLALTRKEDGHWSLNPYFDCGASRSWVVAYSLPFYGRQGTGFKARLK
ncbi:uncharacterized protein LOC119582619 [Penaeus monodon]|uniref:uncharacterized protein LOC119582619 n=1 Tax=Penaeus monodon TaxID=6687 RepID=UPI0018A7C8C8|nr:uncharacterized protein LOC119582619 [Penaeus monodon]